jgi:hypothetical protein
MPARPRPRAEMQVLRARSSRELTQGNGASGTGTPRNSHSGAHPCATSYTRRRSWETDDSTSSLCRWKAATIKYKQRFPFARSSHWKCQQPRSTIANEALPIAATVGPRSERIEIHLFYFDKSSMFMSQLLPTVQDSPRLSTQRRRH